MENFPATEAILICTVDLKTTCHYLGFIALHTKDTKNCFFFQFQPKPFFDRKWIKNVFAMSLMQFCPLYRVTNFEGKHLMSCCWHCIISIDLFKVFISSDRFSWNDVGVLVKGVRGRGFYCAVQCPIFRQTCKILKFF